MTHLTTNVQFLVDGPNYFFSLTLKFDGDSKSDIEFHLKWISEPQKFVILIHCKINFEIIWYSVIYSANLYSILSIFVWSSYILNFVFMNVVILVILNSIWNVTQNLFIYFCIICWFVELQMFYGSCYPCSILYPWIWSFISYFSTTFDIFINLIL